MRRPVRVSLLGDAETNPVELDPGSGEAPGIDLLPTGEASIRPAEGPATRGPRAAVVAPLAALAPGRSRHEVVIDGWRFDLEVEDAARAKLRERAARGANAAGPSAPVEIRAIIPGRVAAVRVVAGDEVEPGRTLLVVEAMKMQNELRAPRAGRVERVAVGEGQTIDVGDLLVVLA